MMVFVTGTRYRRRVAVTMRKRDFLATLSHCGKYNPFQAYTTYLFLS
jgi:hypothetical protein